MVIILLLKLVIITKPKKRFLPYCILQILLEGFGSAVEKFNSNELKIYSMITDIP